MKVRIILDPLQTAEEGEEQLFKAISSQRNGDAHEGEQFLDPAMQDLADLMLRDQALIFKDMMDEISDVIELG